MFFSRHFRAALFVTSALIFCAAPGSCAPQAAPSKVAKAAVTAGMRLQLKSVPSHGLVAQNVDLSALGKVAPRVLASDGSEIPSQFVPDGNDSSRGLLLLQLPHGGDFDLQVVAGATREDMAATSTFTARNSEIEMTFDAQKEGGLPSQIHYLKSGKTFEGFLWRDRLYNGREYSLRNDKNAQLEIATRGALATVVRNRARYLDANGAAAAFAAASGIHLDCVECAAVDRSSGASFAAHRDALE